MSIEVIPRSRWREFLNGFSRAHQGWLVTLESVPPSADPSVLMHNVPLLGVSDDQGRIVVATAGGASHTDRIVDAVALRVDRVEGADRGLEIESADGNVWRLRFRSVVPTELVDGMPSTSS
jgi:RNA:NAD 2'-phosphotransferase (TPT1/KptA family)